MFPSHDRGGELIYDGEDAYRRDLEIKSVRDIELIAKEDPDHDWRIEKHGPLHGETFQRHEDDKWVCIESNDGFA